MAPLSDSRAITCYDFSAIAVYGGMLMDISRVSAIVLAMLAAVLVIIAGKSCADDARNQNARKKSSASERVTIGQQTPGETDVQPAEEDTSLQETADDTTVAVHDATKSILEAYDELHTTSPEETEAEPTTRYIEPATNIVIQLG